MKKYFFPILLTLLLLNGLKDLIQGGAFRSIHPHFEGTCEKVPGIIGAEDMEGSSDLSMLFISSDRRPENLSEATEDGSIYRWDLDKTGTKPEKIPFNKPLGFTFHPHGIGLFENHQGLVRLWVVNHRSMTDTSVEVFDYHAKENFLEHVVSHQNSVLQNANDLIPVDEKAFYVTSDHAFLSPGLKMLEDTSGFGRGYVTFVDGKGGYTLKAEGIPFANGIAMDVSGQHVFVASTMREEIRVFKRDLKSEDLVFEKKIHLNAAPDNLHVDSDGALWVGAHPSILALTLHSKHHQRLAPAEVIEIKNPLSDEVNPREVFLDDGNQISAASIAFRLGDRMILGSIFGDHLLDCRAKDF